MSIGMLDAEDIKKGIMRLTEASLDYMEVITPNRDNYEAMRRKILRKANDLCRHVDALVRNGNGNGGSK